MISERHESRKPLKRCLSHISSPCPHFTRFARLYAHSLRINTARLENAVLKERVQTLTAKVQILAVENASLTAEVEIYRSEASVPSFSKLALGKSADSNDGMDVENAAVDAFVRSGNGVYPNENELTLVRLHDASNPLCCALSADDTVMATGGADATIRISQWGAALNPSVTPESVVKSACRLSCAAPVICVAFSHVLRGVLAAGSMDGSLHLINYSTPTGAGIQASIHSLGAELNHRKYVRGLVWSPKQPILATSSADGTVQIFRAERSGMDLSQVSLKRLESFHLPGAVEAMCFIQDKLVCYARNTPYLSFFDLGTCDIARVGIMSTVVSCLFWHRLTVPVLLSCLDAEDNFKQTKVNLNEGAVGTAAFDEHVSFAVMNLQPWRDKYLAAATDNSRNFILDVNTGKIVRNLYGHSNDGYSQPKVAWSTSGEYLFGNTQEDSSVVVWDIASGEIVERLKGHTSPVRDIYSSPTSDTVVTTAFDKSTRIWFPPAEMA